MTPVLMAVCLLAGLVVGLRWKHRRFLAERRRCGELEAKVDMYDRNALRTDHDVAGPVTPKPRFHDIDPDEPFDDAELLGPDQLAEMRTYSLDEVIEELGFTQAEIDAADDGLVWCVQLDARGHWCALLHNEEPTIGETELETLCGWVGTLPGGLTRTLPTCVECEAFVRDNDAEDEDDPAPMGQRCPWAECPHPDRCDTGCRWGEEANRWAEVIHSEDDTPSVMPRLD